MPRGRILTIQEAHEMLRNIPDDESDHSCDSEFEFEPAEPSEKSSTTQSDNSHGELSEDNVEEVSERTTSYVSGDRSKWFERDVFGRSQASGRSRSENILRHKPGPTSYSLRKIEAGCCVSAFSLLVDDSMLNHIKKCTEAEAHQVGGKKGWLVTIDELEQYIGILYLKGVLMPKSTPVRALWSKKFAPPCFGAVMSKNRFYEITRFLRFDLKTTRSSRLASDKFALASQIWTPFTENCIRCYHPHEHVTVDEQLYPCKARCPFTQYISQKPDKFGIKFWLVADSTSKYMLNGFPYTGKDDSRPKGMQLGEHIVMTLMKPYYGEGINVTTDSFFTSLSLAKQLNSKKITIVGTLRGNRKELPKPLKEMHTKKTCLYSTKVMQEDKSRTTITGYKGKQNKAVFILSSLHKDNLWVEESPKKKPEAVKFYNSTKFGVDVLDAMARYHTTKFGARRWPLHVFFNILDMAAINAWILYKETTKADISRRDFQRMLGLELARQNFETDDIDNDEDDDYSNEQSSQNEERWQDVSAGPSKRPKCQVRLCNENKTTGKKCYVCKRLACGKCTAKTWSKLLCKKCE